jgi:CRP-like cAMP-binding protein
VQELDSNGWESTMSPHTDIQNILLSIPWLMDLEDNQISQLAELASIRRLQPGEELYAEGSREDFFYICVEGQLAVEMQVPTRGIIRIYTAEPFDMVGWSVLTPVVRQRTSGARALLPSKLLSFDGNALAQLCETDHDLGFVLMRRLANTVASRYLTTRIQLLEFIMESSIIEHGTPPTN